MNKSLLFQVLPCWLLILLIAGCQPKQPRIPVMLAEIPVDPGHPVEVAGDSRTGYVYITNEYGDYIYVLRGVEQVVTLRTGGEKADALAVDEERGWVYVVNKGSDSVTAIRGTEVITTLEVAGDEPRDIAVEPASGWAYIVTGYRKDSPEGEKREVEGNVTVISGTEIVGTISLGRVLANRVVVDPINGYVYVGNVGGEVIVIQGMEEIARLKAGSSILDFGQNAHYGISLGKWTAKQPFFGVIAPLYTSLEELCGVDAPLFSFVQSPINKCNGCKRKNRECLHN